MFLNLRRQSSRLVCFVNSETATTFVVLPLLVCLARVATLIEHTVNDLVVSVLRLIMYLGPMRPATYSTTKTANFSMGTLKNCTYFRQH